MKSAIFVAAAVALCGSAFATTQHTEQKPGVVATVKKDAHQIGSAFRHDMHSIARADKFRQEQGMDQQRAHAGTDAMGAAPAYDSGSHDRQARMDEAYARWQRSHR